MRRASPSPRRVLRASIAALFVAGCACAYAAVGPDAVRVEYVGTARTADVAGRPDGDRLRAAYLAALTEHIVARAAPRLPEGSTLDVAISGLATAGTVEPSRLPGASPRVLRDVAPARIELRFVWRTADGSVARTGERVLRDPTLFGSPGLDPGDPLRYEKALIDRWVEREWPAPPGGSG